MTDWIGRTLGYEDVTAIENVRLSFGADWAHRGPAWVFFGCLALCLLSVVFYLRYQQRGRRWVRIFLAGGRAVLLCLLLLVLADPILEIQLTSHPKPQFWVLFDGSDSMAIQDELPADERKKLEQAAGLDQSGDKPQAAASEQQKRSRADYVRALIQKDKDDNVLSKLAENVRLRTYIFDRADGVRAISTTDDSGELDIKQVADQLTTEGEVTALGGAFDDLALRHASSNLAGLLVVSDFDQNAGPVPEVAARKLNVPVYTLGIGPRTAADLAVDLQAPLKMKKAEQSTVSVTLRHQELTGQSVFVRVIARRAEYDEYGGAHLEAIPVGEKEVTLEGPTVSAEFPFTPNETGRFVFAAETGRLGTDVNEFGLPEVEALEGEIVDQNNRAARDVTIIDDFMRLLYVEYEPTWEWRFIKEVFHRDELVGMRGFRTYLRSSDPTVPQTNELFLPSLTMPRSEFFKYDVIFLGDMPASTLSSRFCDMTREFVSRFGGGLVVIAGPRFGPGQLAHTPLADMLPVFVDPDARLRDEREFTMNLTPMALAGGFEFMQLGNDDSESLMAWNNMGRLPWYQPVKSVEPSATTVLAEHPSDTCVDGKTKQPLIAVRKYGRGEVVYVGMNELWRLRRRYGEKYYRGFWGPMIHRLGLSHALGSQKRFVVRTDRQKYQADDKVLVTVEAYNEDFEPLVEDEVAEKTLQAELIRPGRSDDGAGSKTSEMRIAQLRPGVFETRLPVFEGGEYRLRVTDPITKEPSEVHFQVTQLSAERRSAVRNFAIQQNIAAATDGRAYELHTVANLLNDFRAPKLTETSIEIFALWSTWLCFGLVVALMLGEWFFRKMVNLA